MSNARPMSNERREDVYRAQRYPITDRQYRQLCRMDARETNCVNHASGVPVRRPIPRTSQPPQRGSFATHVMVAPDVPTRVRFWKRVPR